ncbi:MAG: glycosyltransferase, partial [Acidimicrobiales bacterium]
MRVLHVIDSLDQGGAETSLTELLPALVAEGLDIVLVTLRDGGVSADELAAAGVRTARIHDTGRIGRARELRRLIRSIRPDLVHATLYESDLASRLALLGTRTPLVTSLVSTPYGPELRAAGIRHWLAYGVDVLSARRVDAAIANAPSVGRTMRARLVLGRRPVLVCPRSRDPERFRPGGVDERAR